MALFLDAMIEMGKKFYIDNGATVVAYGLDLGRRTSVINHIYPKQYLGAGRYTVKSQANL